MSNIGDNLMSSSSDIKPIPPMDNWEWEEYQIHAEVAPMLLRESEDETKKIIQELSDAVMKMSGEIFRLRLTYGEDVWYSCSGTNENNAKRRMVYEAQRDNIKKDMKEREKFEGSIRQVERT